jgi:hypothetical protein
VVLFAYDTPKVNYTKIANQAARLITYTLKLPVTIISEQFSIQDNYRLGHGNGQPWYNLDRYQAYNVSPYNETILLDSDYLILDAALLKILDTIDDYSIIINNQSPKQSMNSLMGLMSLSPVWATAVIFKKTPKAESLFNLVGRIQRNYNYYRRLYNITQQNFRNDYAFAIADNIVNGYSSSPGIPWTMLTLENVVEKIEVQNNRLIVREKDSAHILPRQSLHVMDKDYLQSGEYDKFVDTICQN